MDDNIKGGTTTHYLVPTKVLPLVQVMPFLKPREAELRAKIDKGYARNDPVTTTARATTLVAVEPAAQEPRRPAARGGLAPAVRTPASAEARAQAKAEASCPTRGQG